MTSQDYELWKLIWKERLHKCEVTGVHLTFNPTAFSHIISKGARPDLRYWPMNIVLMSFEAHQLWEFGDRSRLRSLPEWEWVFLLQEYLSDFEIQKRYLQ